MTTSPTAVSDSNLPDLSPGRQVVDFTLAMVDRFRWIIFGAIGVLYLVAFNGTWRMQPDSGMYMELGRNLAKGLGYTYQGIPHRWYEPGLPWVIAGCMKLFHERGGEVAVNVIMMLMAFVSIWLTYVLFRLHASRPVATLIAALVGCNWIFLQGSVSTMTDLPFTLGTLLFLIGYELLFPAPDKDGQTPRAKWLHNVLSWPLLAIGMFAMLSLRPVAMTFVGAVVLASLWYTAVGPRRFVHVGVIVLVVACVAGFRQIDPRRANVGQEVFREGLVRKVVTERTGFFIDRAVHELLPKTLFETVPGALLAMQSNLTDPIVGLLAIAAGVMLFRKRALWGIWIAAMVAQMSVWASLNRYTMPVIPLLLYGLWVWIAWLAVRLPRGWATALIAVAALLYVPGNVGKMIGIAKSQRAHPPEYGVQGERSRDLVAMGKALPKVIKPGDVVLAANHRVLSYLSNYPCTQLPRFLHGGPSKKEVDDFLVEIHNARRLFVTLPLGDTLGKHDANVLHLVIDETPIVTCGELSLHAAHLPDAPATTMPSTSPVK